MTDISRRTFLAGIGAASAVGVAGCVAPTAVKAPPKPTPPPPRPAPTALVHIFLYGGNDGLNTLVPYTDPRYAAARGGLALRASDGLRVLGEGLALHPELAGLAGQWAAGRLAVVRGVGYPGPVLSHFRSQDVWQTARPDTVVGTGVYGRWLDGVGDPLGAVAMSTSLPKMFRGVQRTGISVSSGTVEIPGNATFLEGFARLATVDPSDGTWARAVVQADTDLRRAQQVLNPVLTGARPSGLTLPTVPGALARQLEAVAQLIRSAAVPTKVFNVGLGGWDTHENQKPIQAGLLRTLDQSVGAFLTDVGRDPRGKGTVVLVHSEFGRRVQVNGQGGTDHGTASVAFVAGQPVAGGFYGAQPALDDLDGGNLRCTTDIRRLYSTLIASVLDADPAPILGGTFAPLPFL